MEEKTADQVEKVERRYSDSAMVNIPSIEIRSDSTDSGLPLIEGLTAVFNTPYRVNSYFGSFDEIIKPTAFDKVLSERQDVRALFNHDSNYVLGRLSAGTLTMEKRDAGLFVSIKPSNTSFARDLVESIKRRDITGMSFGFTIERHRLINGEDGQIATREIESVGKLYDVGPVSYPAYQSTTASVSERKYDQGDEIADIKDKQMGAIRSHPTNSTDKAWDGNVNERRVRTDKDLSYYMGIYAWRDSSKPVGEKNTYKFIHHEVSSEGNPSASNIRACQAGISVLNGARGGTIIPDSDREGVYQHLAKHLRDANIEPPELRSVEDILAENRRILLTTDSDRVRLVEFSLKSI